ncbi:MAG TPA: Uma2 family endonuclease [Vicinamibacteria bacterium]|nr:Uma2 family endonuclease [Vicinamibacteria bacterium]
MSSATRVKRTATYEDLCRLPDNVVGEILDGDLYTSPRPSTPHAAAASVLGGELMGPFQHGRGGPGGWWLLLEPELHLGPDIVVPDWAGWRVERLPRIPAAAFLTIPPDWVCEVLSGSTERLDRVKRLAVYAREDVRHAWLVNPIQRTLEVLRLESRRWVLICTQEGDARVRAEPFDAIDLDLALLWAAFSPPEEPSPADR